MTKNRVLAIGLVTASLCSAGAATATAEHFIETPGLSMDVASGDLPPVQARLPEETYRVDLAASDKTIGRHGGTLRLLMGKQKDTRMINVYGYARLIGLNEKLEYVPDILRDFSVKDGRVFTFKIRRGHKWSDGRPFTAEDFRYYWEDMANNPEVSPQGPPNTMLVDGQGPLFEVIDDWTVRFTWKKPNHLFIPWLAKPRPLQIYRPAHYLKTFNPSYGDQAVIDSLIDTERRRDWVELHDSRDRWYRMDNPELPTLQPWRNTIKPPSERFVFTRNPYYHRVDSAGRQLPYIDEIIMYMGETQMIPAKTGAGESDLQARYLRLDHYTFLKESEKRFDHVVKLWKKASGAQIALYPNLNAEDPSLRALMRDVRFRRALSIAINRHEINQVIYYGLANESSNTVLPQSPLFSPHLRSAWTQFDLKQANALLDAIGLTARDEDGLRLMADGRPLIITVDTAGESTEEADVLELIQDGWAKIGIKLLVRPSQRDVFRKRIVAGQTIMSVWSGISNGLATPTMSPEALAPTNKYQLQWPLWGLWGQTGGKAGEEPEMEQVRHLADLFQAWRRAESEAEQARIWKQMLDIHADQVFTIGIVNSTLQPVVISKRLRNVPAEAFFDWDPGAYFGVHKPDTFWLASANDDEAAGQAAKTRQ
ncbi:MAG: ABC transporter substrate-binding protein [Sedimenticolaceae bacterium]